MTVAGVKALHVSGFDVDADQLLDALWLAGLGRSITTVAAPLPPPRSPGFGDQDDRRTATGEDERKTDISSETREEEEEDKPAAQPIDDGPSAVYGAGDVSAEDVTIPAAGIILPSARTLVDRLPLIRALRPLRRQFPSHMTELDEARTAGLTAELRGVAGHGVFPVLRPQYERWFEAHLVVEDDPAIELWSAPLREFSQLLGDSGAFRLVRSWRLRLDASAPGKLAGARLESPAGGLSSPGLLGGARQLIFFASHGRSPHWSNGVYARLLASWPASSVVLLHLQPRSRWTRTVLGEPQALARSLQPGACNGVLELETFWWRVGPDPDTPGVLRLPAASLEPQALEGWARMLMGLGRKVETFLLDPVEAWDDVPAADPAMEERDVGRSLVTLQERSAAAHDLAMMLAGAPFTLPVARLVQEVTQNGSTDFTVLADLMLSGIVAPRGAAPTAARETTYFEVREQARKPLLRSLRGADADTLARSLDVRISRHLSEIAGRTLQFSAIIVHPEGKERLPVWAQEFAHIFTALTDRSTPPPPEGTWRTLLDLLDPAIVGRLARLASVHLPLEPDLVDERLWRHVDDPRLVHTSNGALRFRPAVSEELLRRFGADRYLGVTLLWVDDNPENNAHFVAELQAGGAVVILVFETDEALAHPRLVDCDLVVSDMARGSNGRAGYDLIAGLRIARPSLPVLIFAGHAMANPTRRRAVIAAGAFGGTNRPDELLDLIGDAALAAVLRKGSAARRTVEAQEAYASDHGERTIAAIPDGQFCSLGELHQAIADADQPFAGERIVDSLLFFESARQRSWLIATEHWLLFLLDDPETRREGRLVQRDVHLEEAGDVSAWIDAQGIALFRVGRGTAWYYSAALFEEPAYLETAVRQLISKTIAWPGEAPAPSLRNAARVAMLDIGIDCRDAVVLDIVLEAARLRPAPGSGRGISLSRVFCGAQAMARTLRDPDGSAEPLLHAFGLTLDRAPWQQAARDLQAQFERADMPEALLRLPNGFSNHAKAALLRASEGGLRAASLVEALLDPDERYARSVLYRRIPEIAALRADVDTRRAGAAKEPARPQLLAAEAPAFARAVNTEVHAALGYWTGVPTMPPMSPGMVGTMRDGSFVPLDKNTIAGELARLPARPSEIADIFLTSKKGVQIGGQKNEVRVSFSKRHAMLLHLHGCSVLRLEQTMLERAILELFRQKRWDKAWSVVTEVVRARSTTLLVARTPDAAADFVAKRRTVDIQDMLTDAQLRGGNDIAFRLADARDLTPLFKAAAIRTPLFREPEFVIS